MKNVLQLICLDSYCRDRVTKVSVFPTVQHVSKSAPIESKNLTAYRFKISPTSKGPRSRLWDQDILEISNEQLFLQ